MQRRPACQTLLKALVLLHVYSQKYKNPNISVRYNCQKICSWWRRPETILTIRQKVIFLEVSNKPIVYKFFKGFTNHRKKTNRTVVSSLRPFHNICKNRDHRWDVPTISKTRFLQTEKLSWFVWNFRLTVLWWIKSFWWIKFGYRLFNQLWGYRNMQFQISSRREYR